MAVRRFLAVTDRLFGAVALDEGPARAWLWRYLGMAALIATIIAIRQPDSLLNPQFFAEDALVYYPQNAALGFGRALASLYNGFPVLGQRLVAWLGGLVAVERAPAVYAYVATTINALALATFVLPSFRHLVRSDALRLLPPLAIASLAMGERLLGTAVNIGWFLAPWLSWVTLMPLPRRLARLTALTIAATAAALSTPLVVVNVPLWVIRAVRGLLRRDRSELAFSLSLLAATALIIAVTPRLGAQATMDIGGVPMAVPLTPSGVANKVAARAAGVFVDPGSYGALDAPTGEIVVTLLMLAVTTAAAVVDRRRLPVIGVVVLLVVGSVCVSMLGRPELNFLPADMWPKRYTIYPASMSWLAVVMALDALPAMWCASAALVAASLFAVAQAPSFFLPPFEDFDWPRVGPRAERALTTACPPKLQVPVNPRWEPLVIVWGPMYPEIPPRPEHVVAYPSPVLPVRQQFAAQCDGLSAIEINVDGPVHQAAGNLHLDVFAVGAPATPLVSATLPRNRLAEGWNALCFPPVPESRGREYVAILRTLGGDPIGLRGPSPPAAASGVVVLRHGCLDRAEPTLTFYDHMQASIEARAPSSSPGPEWSHRRNADRAAWTIGHGRRAGDVRPADRPRS